MVAVKSLKRTETERKAEKKALGGEAMSAGSPDDDGIGVWLEHHHLEKMGLGGGLKSGDKVNLEGHGHVESSETRSTKDGERHSARVRITHMGLGHKGEKREDGDVRKDVEAAADEVEKRGKK